MKVDVTLLQELDLLLKCGMPRPKSWSEREEEALDFETIGGYGGLVVVTGGERYGRKVMKGASPVLPWSLNHVNRGEGASIKSIDITD